MFCSVPIWRLVAATDMATGAADPQMQPGVTRFQTFFAPEGARNNVADCREMFAKYRHVFLPRSAYQHASLLRRAECAALSLALLPIRLRRLHLVAEAIRP
jgi:hypothetical protein